jgi:hypothetical protein
MEELVGQCATAIVPDSYMALFNGELAENKCERLGRRYPVADAIVSRRSNGSDAEWAE